MTTRPRITLHRIGHAIGMLIGHAALGFATGVGLWLALRWLQ